MAGRIFINYRRGDDPGNTGRLFDRLQDVFDPEQLFIDVDNIAPGLDFVQELSERVAQCDVLLAVIGKRWIDARDAAGNRRLDDPDDFVRIEIASALSRGKRVIPVLVGDAPMPRSEELPDVLRPLARRNAIRLTHERFRADTSGLIKALQKAFEEIPPLEPGEFKPQDETPLGDSSVAATTRAHAVVPGSLADLPSKSVEKDRLHRHSTEPQRRSRAWRTLTAAFILFATASVGVFTVWFKGIPFTETPRTSQWPSPPQSPTKAPPKGEAATEPPSQVPQTAPPQTASQPPTSSADQPIQLTYSPWIKFCRPQPGVAATQVCFTAKDARLSSGASALAAAIVGSPGEPRILRILLPLGLQIVHGTRVIIDQSQPTVAPYVACGTYGCLADYVASADLIQRMRNGKSLVAQAINASGKPISLVLPLAGFSKAYDGSPTNSDAAEIQKLGGLGLPALNISLNQQTQLIYSPWTKFCLKNKDPNPKTVCFTGKDARIESGVPVMAAVLIEPQDDAKKILRVTLPLGVQLIRGTHVIVDQNTPMTAPYVICFTNGCMADYEASADMIEKMKKGRGLVVQAINDSGQLISMLLPLTDFAKAYGGPPTDPKVFEAQQQKLQEELQKRAEAARKKLEASRPGASAGTTQ